MTTQKRSKLFNPINAIGFFVICFLFFSCTNKYIGYEAPPSCRDALMVFSRSENVKTFSEDLIRDVVLGIPDSRSQYIKLRVNNHFDLFVRKRMFQEYQNLKEKCFSEGPLHHAFIARYDENSESLVVSKLSKEKTPIVFQNEEMAKALEIESELQLFLLSDSNYLWNKQKCAPEKNVQLRIRKDIDSTIGSGRVYEDVYVPDFDERLTTRTVGTIN